ncbi:MAG: signal peptidase I [Lachnospiraceae bacterium]|nr:signal peptidase I [Lachnospiraceae bacterium]
MRIRRNKSKTPIKMPALDELEQEYKRTKYVARYLEVLRSTVFTLITVAAVAVLIAVLLLPVLQIYGTSMTPTLSEGEIVVSVKGSTFETGDVVAFYYNNKILIKRVVCQAGEWFDIDSDGTVYINGEAVEEPYVTDPAFGECDIELPYQVPESRIFVMGDHRSVSVDSRSSTVGCVAEEQIVGKIVFRLWPLNEMGFVH